MTTWEVVATAVGTVVGLITIGTVLFMAGQWFQRTEDADKEREDLSGDLTKLRDIASELTQSVTRLGMLGESQGKHLADIEGRVRKLEKDSAMSAAQTAARSTR